MENKTKKLTAIAAGAVVLTGAAFAAPSFASVKHHTFKAASSSTAAASTPTTAPTWGGASGDAQDGHKAFGLSASLPATVTAVPATVTDAEVAEHGATFIVYQYTGTAPTTQPTTGGRPAHFEATAITGTTATGTIELRVPKTAGTYTFAIYNSKTSTTPVLVSVVVDATLTAKIADTSVTVTSVYDATAQQKFAGRGPGNSDFGHSHNPNRKGAKNFKTHGDNDGDGPAAGWTPSTTATPAPTTGTTTNG